MKEKLQIFAIGFSPDGKEGVRQLEDGNTIVYGIPLRKRERFKTQSSEHPAASVRHKKEYTEQHSFVLGKRKGLRRAVIKETIEKITVWEEIRIGDSRITHVASPYAHVPIEDWQNPTTTEVDGKGRSAIIAPFVLFVGPKRSQ